MDGTLKKKPTKKAAKKRRKYIAVMFEQCADGFAISGLRPGFIKVAPPDKAIVDVTIRDGGLWPWTVVCAGYVKNFGWWAYQVSYTGDARRVLGEEECVKTSNG